MTKTHYPALIKSEVPATQETREVRIKWLAEFGEYVCRVTDNGKRREALDYFTNDREDAYITARDMAEAGPRIIVSEEGSLR